MSKSRTVMGGLVMLAMVAAVLFRVPRAWAAPLHQAAAPNEAVEIIEAQEGIDEPDGQNNDVELNEGQEGVEEQEGQNGEVDELNEGQEGVDEQEGQNGDFEDDTQGGVDEPDGQSSLLMLVA